MSAITNTVPDLLELVLVKDEPRIDSRLLAQQLRRPHYGMFELIKRYEGKLKKLGKVTFQMGASEGSMTQATTRHHRSAAPATPAQMKMAHHSGEMAGHRKRMQKQSEVDSMPAASSVRRFQINRPTGQPDHFGNGPATRAVLADGAPGQPQHIGGSGQAEMVAVLPVPEFDVGPQSGLFKRHFQHAIAIERRTACPFQRPAPVRYLRGGKLGRVFQRGEGFQFVGQPRQIEGKLSAVGVADFQRGARQWVNRLQTRCFGFVHGLPLGGVVHVGPFGGNHVAMILHPSQRLFDDFGRYAVVGDIAVHVDQGFAIGVQHMDVYGRMFIALNANQPPVACVNFAHARDCRETVSPLRVLPCLKLWYSGGKPKGPVRRNTLRQAYATPYDMRGFVAPEFHRQLNFEPVNRHRDSDVGMVFGRGVAYPQGWPRGLSHVSNHHAHPLRVETQRVVSSSVRQGTKTMMQAASVRPCTPTAHHGHTLPTYRDTPAHTGNAGATGNYPVAGQTDAGDFNRDVIAIANIENALQRVMYELKKANPDMARAQKLTLAAMAAVQYVGVEVLQ